MIFSVTSLVNLHKQQYMGSILSTPVTAQHLQRCQSSHLQSGFAELQGWRDDHEDSHIMDCSWGGDSTNRGLFAVFDGHGGSSAAEFAAVYLPLKMNPKRSLTDADIIKYFVECDEAYRQSPDNKAGAAASLLTTERLSNGKYRVKFANAGDSRAIVVSTAKPLPVAIASRSLEENMHKKKDTDLVASEHMSYMDGLHFISDDFDCGVIMTTIDHKPNHPSEKARIEAAGGFVSNDNPARLQGMLALSRMIGDFNYKTNPSLSPGEQMGSIIPEMFTTEAANEGDLVIVACDGIFDVLSNNELARQVRVRLANQVSTGSSVVPDLAKIASDIITLCLNQLDSKDNMSLCIVLLKGVTPEQQAMIPKKVEDELLVGEFSKFTQTNDTIDKRTRKAYEDFFIKVGYFKQPNACNVCHRFFKQMSSCPCKKAIYCDHHCQKLDWKTHRKTCANAKTKSQSPKHHS